MRGVSFILAAVLGLGLAQLLTPQAALEHLFTQPSAKAEWFTP